MAKEHNNLIFISKGLVYLRTNIFKIDFPNSLSHLDRFIAQQNKDREDQERHLKSSLDRFIVINIPHTFRLNTI